MTRSWRSPCNEAEREAAVAREGKTGDAQRMAVTKEATDVDGMGTGAAKEGASTPGPGAPPPSPSVVLAGVPIAAAVVHPRLLSAGDLNALLSPELLANASVGRGPEPPHRQGHLPAERFSSTPDLACSLPTAPRSTLRCASCHR
jgi:hypothetical protein